jgi:hypothetical protein
MELALAVYLACLLVIEIADAMGWDEGQMEYDTRLV